MYVSANPEHQEFVTALNEVTNAILRASSAACKQGVEYDFTHVYVPFVTDMFELGVVTDDGKQLIDCDLE